MKFIVNVFVLVSTFTAYGMTPEEAQAHSAKKLKEAMEHSKNMQKEKARILNEAREQADTNKIDGTDYNDQEIDEQDK